MKPEYAILGAALLVACGPKTETATEPDNSTAEASITDSASVSEPTSDHPVDAVMGYNDGWYLSDGWPGEYPPGFAVLEAGVSVLGRKAMAIDAPLEEVCPLEQNAVYQEWNHERSEADQLEFRTASAITQITLPTGGMVLAIPERDESTIPRGLSLEIAAGEKFDYLRYIAEGFILIGYGGDKYQTLQEDLPEDTVFEQNGPPDDLWVHVTCSNGERVWLTYADAIETDGIDDAPILSYGQTEDLKP